MLQSYNMLIMSGPSGAGKSTLTQFLREQIPNFYFSISTTTRAPRMGEKNGREYFFITRDEFLQDIEHGNFLEHEEVHGNFYGTNKKQIEVAIMQQQFIVFDVDVKGHANIKQHYPFAKSVFVTPRNMNILKERLEKRNTDSQDTIQKRLLGAFEELKYANAFDYLLINDNITHAKETILHIAKSIECLNQDERLDSLLVNYKV